MMDAIVAKLDEFVLDFAGERDESSYVRVREIMATHPEYARRDAFLEKQLEAIDQKIAMLLVHCSLLIAVGAMIATFGPRLIALLAAVLASLFAALAAMLLRCTRVFGALDFRMDETLTVDLILDRMTYQISVRKNVYRKALRVATVATIGFIPILLVAALAALVR
ncbi:hypothetical protein [Prosthecomicrobium sp. N25]|uniref:hypothetical protein n=1 Tax=Prosthecomicrobium sp. N25 TaxID=3129254 RepID=UPI0030769EAC